MTAVVNWTAFSGDMNPPKGDVQLWRISGASDLLRHLIDDERARWERINDEGEKRNYACSQGGLREILGIYSGIAPRAIRLQRAEFGKPFLENGPEFNLSHSAGEILLAVADKPVGLDIESAKRSVNAMPLAAKFFAPPEVEFLSKLDAEACRLMFLRHWVCKEASVKLAGDGIYHGLRDAHVDFRPEGPPIGKYRGRRVWLHEFSPAKGMMAAIASWAPIDVKCFFEI